MRSIRRPPVPHPRTLGAPAPDPRTVIPELESIGEKLYQARAKYMVDTDQGLTKTYNALKDPTCTDARILELRELQEAMDCAVLAAYPKLPGVGSADPNVPGWSDIPVPPYCAASAAEVEAHQAAMQAFEDEVRWGGGRRRRRVHRGARRAGGRRRCRRGRGIWELGERRRSV